MTSARWEGVDTELALDAIGDEVRQSLAVYLPGWSLTLEIHSDDNDVPVTCVLYLLRPDAKGQVELAARRRGSS